MKVLTAIRVSGSEGTRRLLPTLALTWILVFLLGLNSYAGEAENLIDAAKKGNILTVHALLAKGADVNAKDDDGWTAFMQASFYGHLDVAQALLAKGADVNVKDNNGMTALMHVSEIGPLDLVQALLAKGADVNVKDNYGRTALIVAVGPTYAHLDIVQALLAKGADVNQKDKGDRTALSLAKEQRHNEIAQLLIKAGAKDVNNSGEAVKHGIVVGLICGFLVVLSVFLVKYLRKKHIK